MKRIILTPKYYLWLAIILYLAVFFTLSIYKYQNFLYNLEDLAIFNNVLYHTAQGNLFWFSPHGGFSYLGDHLELGLLLLLPIYYFFQTPLTLLFLQTALFALSAWPLFLITQKIINGRDATCLAGRQVNRVSTSLANYLPLFIALLFLLNPFLHNINLEEFHVAPLLLFFFLWTFYFYLQKRYRLFILFFILTLLIREDAALTLGMLAIIAAWDIFCRRDERPFVSTIGERPFVSACHSLWRHRKWWLYPLLLSASWFLAGQKIVQFFNPQGEFRYLLLYQTLLLGNPSQILAHLLDLKNLWLIIGLLLPFLFLPLWQPKYLWLALPTFLQLFLTDSGGSSVILSTHYQIFILAALFLALSQTLVCFSQTQTKRSYRPLLLGLLLFSQFYVNYFWGPLKLFQGSNPKAITNLEDKTQNEKMMALIPPGQSVSAPYRFLPHLSSREKIYVNKLVFVGKGHLSQTDFQLPADTDYLLIDSADMIEYYLHFQNRGLYSALYWGGAERMRQTIARQNFQPLALTDSLILFKKDKKDAAASTLPYQMIDHLPTGLRGKKTDLGEIKFLGWQVKESIKTPPTIKQFNNLTIHLFFSANQKITDDYFLEIAALDANQKILWQKIYPPAYGLLPTHDWPIDKYIQITQILPADLPIGDLKISFIKIKGDIELGPLNDTQLVVDRKKKTGEFTLSR